VGGKKRKYPSRSSSGYRKKSKRKMGSTIITKSRREGTGAVDLEHGRGKKQPSVKNQKVATGVKLGKKRKKKRQGSTKGNFQKRGGTALSTG